MKRLVSDFEYPLATGLRVPTASIDGLCVGCLAAWPCTRCPDPFANPIGEVASSGGIGVVNPLKRPAPVPSSTPEPGPHTAAAVLLAYERI